VVFNATLGFVEGMLRFWQRKPLKQLEWRLKLLGFAGNYADYDWFSYPEEWEKYIQELENLPNRCFFAKHKIEGGVLPLRTVDVLPAYEEFGIEKEDFERLMDEIVFGKKYLLERRQKS
jgi:hypothetical protein